MPNNEPGKLVLNIFDQLVSRIKSTRPVQTDGKSLTTGFVYSQLVLGRMVDPRDYLDPWSPIGGATLQDTLVDGDLRAKPDATEETAEGDIPAINPKYQRALSAAYRTSQLADSMIMVTKDDTYLSYPAERKVSFAYEGIVNGMQPLPAPDVSAEIKQQIKDAQKVLYELEEDDDGNFVTDEEGYYVLTGYESRLYASYLDNAADYADAKHEYSKAQQEALADPRKAQSWPMDALYYQRKVDDAWDRLKTMGAERIEKALDTIKSVGVSLQARMIAKARQVYDAWNLGLAGVPTAVPYSYIEPSGWCDPNHRLQGWQTLTVSSKDVKNYSASSSATNFEKHWESHASSKEGKGKVSFGFGFFNRVKAGAGGGSSTASSAYELSSSSESGYEFKNDAEGLEIEIEYGLCTIHRPWLIGDLFYMRNWYLVNNPQNAISDGSIDNQVKSEEPLLPMIPRQFLAIRNVKITAKDWHSDGKTFKEMHESSRGKRDRSSKFVSGSAGFSIGFLSVGGGGASSSSDSETDQSGGTSNDSRREFGWRFHNETLEIKGTQIVAWLSEVVPACAPLGDPGLK
ncbi:MAG: hypothetical protein WA885_25295 [Phormidesmis sp.]